MLFLSWMYVRKLSYLNKTCFNGLWRVNSKGYYNVPMGSYKNPAIYDQDAIMSASLALQNAEIEHTDFAKVQELAKSVILYISTHLTIHLTPLLALDVS